MSKVRAPQIVGIVFVVLGIVVLFVGCGVTLSEEQDLNIGFDRKVASVLPMLTESRVSRGSTPVSGQYGLAGATVTTRTARAAQAVSPAVYSSVLNGVHLQLAHDLSVIQSAALTRTVLCVGSILLGAIMVVGCGYRRDPP